MSKEYITVSIQTTKGGVNATMTHEQVIDLATMLQAEEEPVPVKTLDEEYQVVGMLIQGRVYTKYPRIIVVEGD